MAEVAEGMLKQGDYCIVVKSTIKDFEMQHRPTTSLGKAHQIILDLLYGNLGKAVSNQRLYEAVGSKNWDRRLRELRENEGWQIPYDRKHQGYIMHTTKRTKDATERWVSLRLRTEVFARDKSICQECGHAAGQKYPDGKTVRLEADHIVPFIQGGLTEIDNLQTLCTRCNAGKKAAIAYGKTDEKVSLVIRLDQQVVACLEQKAKGRNISAKELIQRNLEAFSKTT